MLKRQRGEVGVKSENANAKKRKTKATAEDLPPELTEPKTVDQLRILKHQYRAMFRKIKRKSWEINSLRGQVEAIHRKDYVRSKALVLVHTEWSQLQHDLAFILRQAGISDLSTSSEASGDAASSTPTSPPAPISTSESPATPSTTAYEDASHFLQLVAAAREGDGEALKDIGDDEISSSSDDDDESYKNSAKQPSPLTENETEKHARLVQELQKASQQTTQVLQSVANSIGRLRGASSSTTLAVKKDDTAGSKDVSSTGKSEEAGAGKSLQTLRQLADVLQTTVRLQRERMARLARKHQQIKEAGNQHQQAVNVATGKLHKVFKELAKLKQERSLEKNVVAQEAAAVKQNTAESAKQQQSEGEVGLEEQVSMLTAQCARSELEWCQIEREKMQMSADLAACKARVPLQGDAVRAHSRFKAKEKELMDAHEELKGVQVSRERELRNHKDQLESLETELQMAREQEAKDRKQVEDYVQTVVKELGEVKVKLSSIERERDRLQKQIEEESGTGRSESSKDKLLADMEAATKRYREEVETLKGLLELQQEGGALDKLAFFRLLKSKEKSWQERERQLKAQVEAAKPKSRWAKKTPSSSSLLSSSTNPPPAPAQSSTTSSSPFPSPQEALEKVAQELEDIKKMKGGDFQEMSEALEAEKELVMAFTSEIETLATNYEELQDAHQKLLETAKQQEESNGKLVNERLKAMHVTNILKKEKDLLKRSAEASQDTSKMREKMAQEARKSALHASNMASKLEERVRMLEKQLEAKSKSHLMDSTAKAQLSAQVQELTEKLGEENKKIQAHIEANLALKKDVRKAEDRVTLAQSKARSKSTGDLGLERELATMKSKLSCSVCSYREKSVVITKCFHCFCAECIEANLKVRLRKCPGCGTTFDKSDVQPIYLT